MGLKVIQNVKQNVNDHSEAKKQLIKTTKNNNKNASHSKWSICLLNTVQRLLYLKNNQCVCFFKYTHIFKIMSTDIQNE